MEKNGSGIQCRKRSGIKKFYKSGPVRFLRHLLLTEALFGLLAVIVILPCRVSLFLGRVLGLTACRLYRSYRRSVEKNLFAAFPSLAPVKLKKLRNRIFMNMGMNMVEFGLFAFRSKKFWMGRIDIVGNEILEGIFSKGMGVICMSAHVGNWELLGAYLAMLGHPVNVVAREATDRRLNRLLVAIRERMKVKTIYRSGRSNMRKMVACLKKGELLGVLIDQDTKVGGIFVDFFGRPAYTPTAVSQFARLKGTSVVSGFIFRKKDNTHRVVIQGPLPGGEDIEKETGIYTGMIENFIEKHPEQWVWMHPRWKRRPE